MAGAVALVTVAPGDERRAVSDEQGRFSFAALPVGEHKLALRGAAILPVDITVALHEGKSTELSLFVDVKERYASTVRGRRAVVETVEQTLTTAEIQRIPGTQGDTLKAVQNLPGVARAPFGIGLLPVWGSAPADTRVYIDGVNVPVLYHFGGLRSTVNSEMIDALTFVPGGYQADHGLGLGGIVDVDTRRPRTDGLHGYAQMDLLDGSLMLEGPITKTLSFAVAGRRSWIDATLPLFTTSTFQLSPVYYDYQARLSWRPSGRDVVDLFLFGSDDQLSLLARVKNDALDATVDSHTFFHRALLSWAHRFDRGRTLTVTSSVGYDAPFGLGVAFGQTPTSLDERGLRLRHPRGRPLADHQHAPARRRRRLRGEPLAGQPRRLARGRHRSGGGHRRGRPGRQRRLQRRGQRLRRRRSDALHEQRGAVRDRHAGVLRATASRSRRNFGCRS